MILSHRASQGSFIHRASQGSFIHRASQGSFTHRASQGSFIHRALLCLMTLGIFTPHEAFAHHVTGSRLPQTTWEGLLSGLAHPVIEMDHFAFIIAAGMLAAMAPRRLAWLVPLPLLTAMITGSLIHLQGWDILHSEGLVLLSLIIAAPILWLASRRYSQGYSQGYAQGHSQGYSQDQDSPLPTWVILGVTLGLFPIAGLIHGYAYAESIIGAQTTTVASYLVGFSVIQYAIMASIIALIRWKSKALPILARGTGAWLLIIVLIS